ncbi:universal stress protein [Halalkalicoccus sp. NIPERK01]|uniref:universal stress protein n=1 Tax=Halalkalicoccus sp. NIPERK01 TaxID=3053469 RepID=UPI00256EE6CA|nr:universal stress protein [Halalkalicoccus sp. NIPERK01]MDL5363003.1 universal stress protein [Halalkalicoccus sp. NIPERK01]
MTRRVLVPIDGSPHADRALEYACENHADSEITALFVLDPFGYYEEERGFPDRLDDWYANLEERADRLFEEAGRRAADHGVGIETATERGRPDRAIVAYAVTGDFDAIVMGAHGRTDLTGVLLGSTAEKVARRAPCPVTVVR